MESLRRKNRINKRPAPSGIWILDLMITSRVLDRCATTAAHPSDNLLSLEVSITKQTKCFLNPCQTIFSKVEKVIQAGIVVFCNLSHLSNRTRLLWSRGSNLWPRARAHLKMESKLSFRWKINTLEKKSIEQKFRETHFWSICCKKKTKIIRIFWTTLVIRRRWLLRTIIQPRFSSLENASSGNTHLRSILFDERTSA